MEPLEKDLIIDQEDLLLEESLIKDEPIVDINIKHRRPKWIK